MIAASQPRVMLIVRPPFVVMEQPMQPPASNVILAMRPTAMAMVVTPIVKMKYPLLMVAGSLGRGVHVVNVQKQGRGLVQTLPEWVAGRIVLVCRIRQAAPHRASVEVRHHRWSLRGDRFRSDGIWRSKSCNAASNCAAM